MYDNSEQIIEDIKWILFDDRDFDSLATFVAWVDEHAFIIQDEEGQEYRVTVTKERI